MYLLHDVLCQFGSFADAQRAMRVSARTDPQQEDLPKISLGRLHAPPHHSLSFIHDRSLRYGR